MNKYVKPVVGMYSSVLDYLDKTVCKDCGLYNKVHNFSCADFRERYFEFGKQYERFV